MTTKPLSELTFVEWQQVAPRIFAEWTPAREMLMTQEGRAEHHRLRMEAAFPWVRPLKEWLK